MYTPPCRQLNSKLFGKLKESPSLQGERLGERGQGCVIGHEEKRLHSEAGGVFTSRQIPRRHARHTCAPSLNGMDMILIYNIQYIDIDIKYKYEEEY